MNDASMKKVRAGILFCWESKVRHVELDACILICIKSINKTSVAN